MKSSSYPGAHRAQRKMTRASSQVRESRHAYDLRNGFRIHVQAAETVRYGSGKLAYSEGDLLCVVVAPNRTKYVYHYDATFDAMNRGIGLLYTYGPEITILLDGKEIA